MTKTFVVAGATGRQGSATARHLINAGHRVIGITHSPSKVPRIESMGGAPLIADLRDSAKLIGNLKGVDGFFLVTDPFSRIKETDDVDVWVKDEVLQGEQALDAARKANVPQVVLGSVSHVGSDEGLRKYGLLIHKTKLEVEKRANELGLSYTSLRPPFFLDDWIPSSVFPTPSWMESGRLEAAVRADTPIPHIATDDIGRIAAWSFDHPHESIGQAWEIVGEVTTYPSICRTLSEHYHRQIVFKEIPESEDGFLFHRALVRTVYTWDAGQWERKFGLKMTTFEEFLRRLPPSSPC